ncbi:DivIVA domain-containing protein [Salinibacterium sp. NG253]|uniref:DivIVA domain-containing protein n=1 Tax=Salinibacterium sp. NG253 TaxID=2792039 RepID=UPI0018CF0C97|nr:DivIVA domain-containing protein [Salinibacterium sp. NG253]MBH0115356.1 DivIVA domain-containing protein [Salinibacterium sp. NG253]
MALTPEDVVNKRFESTKFREGYDQDDVDDFLDEVVVELRRLNQENDELRQRLSAAEARATELQQNASSAPAAAAPAAIAAPAPAAIESAPAPAAPAAIEPASSVLDDASSTNNLLQLARRLHEEHVREGVQKRDALIAEGQASAAEILAEGKASAAEVVAASKATAAELVAEAEAQQREQIGTLEREREALEGRIESLRSFEREYREKLKSYIEGQLHELDSSSLVTAGGSSAQQGHAPASQPSGHLTPEDFSAPQSAQQPPASFSGFSGS